VYPVFWRLHCWVDARIEDWYAAHNAAHPGQVTRKAVGAVSWFAKGPWVSLETPWVGAAIAEHGPGGHAVGHEQGGHGHPGHDIVVMQRVYDLIFNPATTAVVAASGTRAPRSAQFTRKIFRE
jgi:hypothetical protein